MLFRVAERLDQAKARHLAEVADQRRQRHALEQGVPHRNVIEPLRGNRFARQIELSDEFYDLAGRRSTLCLFKRLNKLWQFSDGAVLGDAILTADLALHLAFTEGIGTGQHPAEYRVVPGRWRLRVSETEQVGVRPAV